ncbi:MAG: hypothetical protein KGQ46_10325 [Hyphomicrobiales bacterium]|nr:hypothetical protein [Hyphomicrobiales bacterium]MDE2114312.1 hypothetical protein [Hyphomicrobiales bacterium]
MYRNFTLCLAMALPLMQSAQAGEVIPGTDPKTGYRIGYYDGDTPNVIPGATLIHTPQAKELVDKGAVLIDVLASKGDGHDPLDGTWPTLPPRTEIAGTTWLPDVGSGTMDSYLKRYFKTNLEKLAGPPPGKPVIFYCHSKCWMAWNAGVRAARWGYKQVYWYPSGTDGWSKAKLPLVPAQTPPAVDMN